MSQTPGQERPDRKSYRRLLGHVVAYWKGWILLAVVMIASSLVGLLQPWPMKVLIDHVLGSAPMSAPLAVSVGHLPGADTARGLLVWVVLAGLAVFALNSFLDVVLCRAWIRVGQQMVYDVAADLFAQIVRRSLVFHRRNSIGDSLSRITGDSWCVYRAVDNLFLTPKYALIMLAGMVIVMAQMDVLLTLLALAMAPFMAGSAFIFGRPVRRLARLRRQIESQLQAHVQQTLSGIPVVQAFAQEDRQQQRFEAFTDDALRAQWRGTLIGSLSALTSGLAVTLGSGAVLWIGARHVLEGRLSVGGLFVFIGYLGPLQAQLKSLTAMYSMHQEIAASADRVLELLETEVEVNDRPGALPLKCAEGHLRFDNVTFGYEPGRPVLRNVSLEVRPGETVALVGATGAGKTTLVGLVPRFFDPWEGRVLIDGHDVRDVQVKDLRSQVGLVLQEPFLLPLTIAQNIAYGRPDASLDDIEVAARAANVHDFIERLPKGYHTPVRERGTTLSGGEQQRLSIARALLKNAPILILDEPTSALDAETEQRLLHALVRLMRGRSTLIIAHRLSTVRNADRIVVLHEGQVAEQGTHRELLARDGRYARLYRIQAGERSTAASLVG